MHTHTHTEKKCFIQYLVSYLQHLVLLKSMDTFKNSYCTHMYMYMHVHTYVHTYMNINIHVVHIHIKHINIHVQNMNSTGHWYILVCPAGCFGWYAHKQTYVHVVYTQHSTHIHIAHVQCTFIQFGQREPRILEVGGTSSEPSAHNTHH